MGKTLCLNLYPWRNQSWSPFPPISDVLCPLASALGSLGWISVKPSLVETSLSLGAGHSVQRNSLQENRIFSPSHLQAPCLHVPPQNNTLLTPTSAPTRSCVSLTPGQHWSSHLDCCQRKQTSPSIPHPKREGAGSNISQRGEGRGDMAEPLHPALCQYRATPAVCDFSWERTPLLHPCHKGDS